MLFLATTLVAQEQSQTIHILPQIEINAQVQSLTQEIGHTISQDTIERNDAHDLSQAIRHTPGVIISEGGSRNESSFVLRGFKSNSVPIFVDGMAVSNPYRGSSDIARTLSGDLENVTIQKGYSSRLLGANTLGGAIMMRTAKPRKKLDAKLSLEQEFDNRYKAASHNILSSLGTKQELYYLKATYQQRDRDHYRLSNDFEPTTNNPQQKGNRLFSDSKDTKLTLITGITPTDSLDIWATYIHQDADKGVSPPETTVQDYSIWDWTQYERESVSLATTYRDSHFDLEAKLNYDTYDNALNEYWSLPSYRAGIHVPSSRYDQSAIGARLRAGWKINPNNKLSMALSYKHEKHASLSDNEQQNNIVEDTTSVGVEYTNLLSSKLKMIYGLGYDSLTPKSYWDTLNSFSKWLGAESYVVKPKSHWLTTGQLALFYELNQDTQIRLTYARKNRFASMSQRYATRYGRSLPNPTLYPEIADHFELGYKGEFSILSIDTSIYYSKLKDKIVIIEVPNPEYPTILVDYNLNLDAVDFYGYELSAEALVGEDMMGGLAFSWNLYSIGKSSNKMVEVIDYYPEFTASSYIIYALTPKIALLPNIEYVDSRYATIDRSDKLESYLLAHLKVTYDYNDSISFFTKVDNILDTHYEVREFYPQAGRSFSVNMSMKY